MKGKTAMSDKPNIRLGPLLVGLFPDHVEDNKPAPTQEPSKVLCIMLKDGVVVKKEVVPFDPARHTGGPRIEELDGYPTPVQKNFKFEGFDQERQEEKEPRKWAN
jgi:hypothetical protein